MIKDKPNKIPRPQTIARHFAEGKYCDYPADILMEAVNSHNYDYNPTAIPIKLGFGQIFVANFNALIYLSNHRDENEIQSFLADPNGYMAAKGIVLAVPFDDIAPRIFVTLIEDDMLAALRDPKWDTACDLLYSRNKESWRYRHPERYDKNYMNRKNFYSLNGVPFSFDKDYLKANGFNEEMDLILLFITRYFAEI